ncbi:MULTISPECIES: hypothetical protein [Paenibacillus]|uniref:hypothetical protein n=1 Tax=Paenibacillus TaxID=44249 RepID=UPI0022B888CB|nr:hypothetical protein [Paenibacillus caseinilyticus]MCZ8523508.1 hypothetical protein [Paenibacillus caseinilyticus]
MEKYQPIAMPAPMPTPMPAPMPAPMPSMKMPAPMPNMMPTATAPISMPKPVHYAPVNVNAKFEEINIYAPPKPHYPVQGVWSSAGYILVLYILLVIILRSGKCHKSC